MSFFKNLFGKKEGEQKEDEPFVPTPTQNIPGLEPIVVQAIENLYPDAEDQQKAFTYSLEYLLKYKEEIDMERDGTRGLLATLMYSRGKIEELPELKYWFHGRAWLDGFEYTFPTMKDAEDWVKSIKKPGLKN